MLAFSCKCRYFCPSCHAKRLAVWSLWLQETLLAPVPHRQVVLTLPKRLRPYSSITEACSGTSPGAPRAPSRPSSGPPWARGISRSASSPRSRPTARWPTGIPTSICW
ncbi:MAG: transposase zinc-binding domain-containing protein [Gemmatimonadetes bacterium]|nr:transposase zinc-binding domain-containing protein [Gemmatimonadota bacterium]